MNSMSLTVSYGAAAVLGVVAAVFGVLALVGISPEQLAPAGVIALGLAELMPEEMFGQTPPRKYWLIRAALGAIAIVLGGLVLFGSSDLTTMVGLGVIALGIGLFLPLGTQAGARGRLEWGLRAFCGLAVIVLGLLALLGTTPLTLLAVAIIVLGVITFAP